MDRECSPFPAADCNVWQVSDVWVVLPAFNEADNLSILIPRLFEHGGGPSGAVRALVVDDGSTDDTPQVLERLTATHAGLVVRRIPRNRGKSSALREGFLEALEGGASIVVMMDADGQDDPAELHRLLAALDEGYDLVTGARLHRQDRFVKRSTSRLYNRTTGLLTGVPGSDQNSGYKAMRATVVEELEPMLYGELHRYITVIADWLGFRVTEIPVAHHERLHGSTKYGVSRFWRGFLDLLTVRFLMSYEQRPSHLFGGLGTLSLLVGGVMLGYLLVERLLGQRVGDRPLLAAGVLLVIVGLQLVLFGLLAELIVYGRHHGSRRDDR